MLIQDADLGRSFLARLDHGSEIISQITEIAREKQIEEATFYAIGALSRADLGCYDQASHEYHVYAVEEPVELASCSGNISPLKGQPFVHAHAVLGNGRGQVLAGHLVRGTIFAAEICMQELNGRKLKLSRTPDFITGLNLWTSE